MWVDVEARVGPGEIASYDLGGGVDGPMEVFMNGGLWGRALDTFVELGCHSMDILIFRYLAFKVNGLQI